MRQLAFQFAGVFLISLFTIWTFLRYSSRPLIPNVTQVKILPLYLIKRDGMKLILKAGKVKVPAIKTPQQHQHLPMLYVITPTFPKPIQIAELTALGNSLKNVKNITWIVVEDSHEFTEPITRFLRRFGVPFVQLLGEYILHNIFIEPCLFVFLTGPMDGSFKDKNYYEKPRGLTNRNRALEWIRANASDGVLYFADDDNTYDPLLWDQVRRYFSFLFK